MSLLFKTNGTRAVVFPENGNGYQLKELYTLLEVDMVQVVHLKEGYILVCDEEGKLKNEPQFNPMATILYQGCYGPCDEIYGNALLCLDKEFR